MINGIPEIENENTEKILNGFMKDKMNIENDVYFHRVHRLGRSETVTQNAQ